MNRLIKFLRAVLSLCTLQHKLEKQFTNLFLQRIFRNDDDDS